MNERSQLPYLRSQFYPRERRSVPLAREFAQKAMVEWRAAAHLHEVLLCVSELATNALQHGVPPGRGFLLQLTLAESGLLRVELHDTGGGAVESPAQCADSESGRGLLLVSVLADKWGVGPRYPGKIVWCEFVRATVRETGQGCSGIPEHPQPRTAGEIRQPPS